MNSIPTRKRKIRVPLYTLIARHRQQAQFVVETNKLSAKSILRTSPRSIHVGVVDGQLVQSPVPCLIGILQCGFQISLNAYFIGLVRRRFKRYFAMKAVLRYVGDELDGMCCG